MPKHKKTQSRPKTLYRVKNWSEYDKALVQRGSLTFWLPVPDHSTLSKRGKGLKVNLPKKPAQNLDIVMDSTGLKIYGEGEWKVRMHGVSKRRTWRKLHVGLTRTTAKSKPFSSRKTVSAMIRRSRSC